MTPITDSPYKEGRRRYYEQLADRQKATIQSRLDTQLSELKTRSYLGGTAFIVVGFMIGILLACVQMRLAGILDGLILGLAAWGIVNLVIKFMNAQTQEQRKTLQEKAQKEIAEAYAEQDRRAVQEFQRHDQEAKAYCKRVLQQGEKLEPMVDCIADMFQRMISHADARAHKKFVQAAFVYEVEKTGIKFGYPSTYSNPLNSYNFQRERFRDLTTQAEVEGLARALSKMVTKKMEQRYAPNPITITVSHEDAKVTLHFKQANPNFVPSQYIA